jgi:Icc-related predicted phosphoesterase
LRNWAFYGDKQYLLNQFNKIPDDVNILITHCPPKYGLQGTVLETNWNYMSDFGCVELQQVIDERFADKDMWVLSGHIHSGKHTPDQLVGTNVVNVSIKDEDYKPSYDVFVFEI